jgi:selenophosphate synthase
MTRLTQQVKAGGCASKLAPGSLHAVLDSLSPQTDPNLLVGFDQSDDAGVYLLVSVEAGSADTLVQAQREAGVPAHPIGQVSTGKPGIILHGDR